jgi:hypothetical protein
MNTSIQHPPHLPGTPQEGNLSEAQTPFTPSEDALRVKETVDGIGKSVAGAIEEMERRRDEFLPIEAIADACVESENPGLISIAKIIRETGNVNVKDNQGFTALYTATLTRNRELCAHILTHPLILVNDTDSRGWTAFLFAIWSNNIEITKLLLNRPEILINEQIKDTSNTALFFAVREGCEEILRLLLTDSRLDLKEHDQWKKALEQAETPEIKALIEEAMRKQGIEF